MFQSLPLFKTATAMARYAGQRQALIARNMANSDTPGFAPQDLPAFASVLRSSGEYTPMRATRPGHSAMPMPPAGGAPFTRHGATAPNGNAVSLETELVKSVEASRQHDRALAIYRSGLTILRSSLSKA